MHRYRATNLDVFDADALGSTAAVNPLEALLIPLRFLRLANVSSVIHQKDSYTVTCELYSMLLFSLSWVVCFQNGPFSVVVLQTCVNAV